MTKRVLNSRIANSILKSRGDLDNVPSVVIKHVVDRVLSELEEVLPKNEDGVIACSAEEIFEEWTLCECGELVLVERARFGDDYLLCPGCYEEFKRECENEAQPSVL